MKRMAAGTAGRAASDTTDARTANECGVTAERLALEAEALSAHLHGNEQLIDGLTQQIGYLEKSPHKSDTRRDALSHLRAAAGLLLLEIGTREPEWEWKS